MMKKITALSLAALLMLAGLTACGGSDVSNEEQNGADVDVTRLSSTMVYSVVYDMLTFPNKYMGKKIRISGNMSVYHEEETGNTYYACFIQDAALE